MESISELLNFAVAKEEEAAAFYDFLASASERENIREVFRELAENERSHKKVFEKILTGGPKHSGVLSDNVNLLISDYLVDVTFDPKIGYQDALILAMKREEKSNRLYLDLSRKANDQELSRILLNMAEEEARHKARIEIIYEEQILTED